MTAKPNRDRLRAGAFVIEYSSGGRANGRQVPVGAPTPGGLGAMEAALIGGLVAAGLDNTVAVPAVFMYRLFTFWIPILPGWFSFHWLQRHDYI